MQSELNTLFLRKSKLFNKGRYSRTRQIVRGAFFFSLMLNIAVIYGALFLYYLYTINFGNFWWLLWTLTSCFVIPSFLRQQPKKLPKLNINAFLKFNLFFLNLKIIYWRLQTNLTFLKNYVKTKKNSTCAAFI